MEDYDAAGFTEAEVLDFKRKVSGCCRPAWR
jgi:hypothetical protein